METRLKAFELESIKRRCGFSSCLAVDCRGEGRERSGGIVLMWGDNVDVSIGSYSLNHIMGSCQDHETNVAWSFCRVYGFPEEQNKRLTWELITSLKPADGTAWICFGDLNDTLRPNEKIGGNARSNSQVTYGRESTRNCALNDLGFEGYPFTWSNGRKGVENIQGRLDRALGNEEFQNRFNPIISVQHLAKYGSDHMAISISLENHCNNTPRRRTKIFRFEESWSKEGRCEALVAQCWNRSVGSCKRKIDSIQLMSGEFEDHNLGKIKKELVLLEKELKEPLLEVVIMKPLPISRAWREDMLSC